MSHTQRMSSVSMCRFLCRATSSWSRSMCSATSPKKRAFSAFVWSRSFWSNFREMPWSWTSRDFDARGLGLPTLGRLFGEGGDLRSVSWGAWKMEPMERDRGETRGECRGDARWETRKGLMAQAVSSACRRSAWEMGSAGRGEPSTAALIERRGGLRERTASSACKRSKWEMGWLGRRALDVIGGGRADV